MRVLLTGSTGGIGSAIKERLKDYELTCVPRAEIETDEEFDWMITAHGTIDEDNVYETFVANVLSQIHLTQKIKAKNIIFISSTAGIKGNDGYPIYAASKAALNMYCKSISSKVNCWALCPGPTDTPLLKHLDIEKQSPEKVARAVECIMSYEFKSGEIITVRDGIITCGTF